MERLSVNSTWKNHKFNLKNLKFNLKNLTLNLCIVCFNEQYMYQLVFCQKCIFSNLKFDLKNLTFNLCIVCFNDQYMYQLYKSKNNNIFVIRAFLLLVSSFITPDFSLWPKELSWSIRALSIGNFCILCRYYLIFASSHQSFSVDVAMHCTGC